MKSMFIHSSIDLYATTIAKSPHALWFSNTRTVLRWRENEDYLVVQELAKESRRRINVYYLTSEAKKSYLERYPLPVEACAMPVKKAEKKKEKVAEVDVLLDVVTQLSSVDMLRQLEACKQKIEESIKSLKNHIKVHKTISSSKAGITSTQIAADYFEIGPKLFHEMLVAANIVKFEGQRWYLAQKYKSFGLTVQASTMRGDAEILFTAWTTKGKAWLLINWDSIRQRAFNVDAQLREKYSKISNKEAPSVVV